jgi:hypothetical protein
MCCIWRSECQDSIETVCTFDIAPEPRSRNGGRGWHHIVVSFQRSAVGATETSWTNAEPLRYRSYFALIQLGDIEFRVALDTGSSDFWISSTACTTSACNSVPRWAVNTLHSYRSHMTLRYPLNYQSPSFVSVNDNQTVFNLSYADGTCKSITILLSPSLIAIFMVLSRIRLRCERKFDGVEYDSGCSSIW